jgi:hypothetical protein
VRPPGAMPLGYDFGTGGSDAKERTVRSWSRSLPQVTMTTFPKSHRKISCLFSGIRLLTKTPAVNRFGEKPTAESHSASIFNIAVNSPTPTTLENKRNFSPSYRAENGFCQGAGWPKRTRVQPSLARKALNSLHLVNCASRVVLCEAGMGGPPNRFSAKAGSWPGQFAPDGAMRSQFAADQLSGWCSAVSRSEAAPSSGAGSRKGVDGLRGRSPVALRPAQSFRAERVVGR